MASRHLLSRFFTSTPSAAKVPLLNLSKTKRVPTSFLRDENVLPTPKLPSVGEIHMRRPARLDIAPTLKNDATILERFGLALAKSVGFYNLKGVANATAIKISDDLENVEAAHARFYYEVLKLPCTFHTWFSIIDLHLWMLTVRFRKEPDDKKLYKITENLMNVFFDAAQTRLHGPVYRIKSSRKVDNLLKEYLVMHHGAFLAYDESITRGDAVLGMALWRNVFGGDKKATAHQIALLVQYVRQQLYVLDHTPIDCIRDAAAVPFVTPSEKLVDSKGETKFRKVEPTVFQETLEKSIEEKQQET